MLTGKTIVLGVCGGIAAYKAAALCSKLVQGGARVRVIMTENAGQFIAPLTFQALSRDVVISDTFAEADARVISHIDWADHADLFVVAPATANMIGKMAMGLADDMLSTTLLATPAPIIVAPAMNGKMYHHPAVQHNMQLLAARGVRFVEPGEGLLACGYVGKGRLAEPEEIFRAIERMLSTDEADIAETLTPSSALANTGAGDATLSMARLRVLVTAGGTIERLDPVRYFTNDSSGKMGFAIAEAARDRGAAVTLVCARTSEPVPEGVEVVKVSSALEMLAAVQKRMPEQDIIVKAAAVADYRPEHTADRKIKKKADEMTITLVKNPDILQWIGEHKTTQFVIGFAAETDRLAEHALDKLIRKKCDLLVANDVTLEGAGFGTATNIVHLFDKQGEVEAWPLLSKSEIGQRLMDIVMERLNKRIGEQ